MKMTKKGFTLIELLVVIAIIAILAAILFPVFAKARDKARQAACISNLKQMSLGVIMYSEDYDGMFPANARWIDDPADPPGGEAWLASPSGNWHKYSWQQSIYPYTKNIKVTECPNQPANSGHAWYNYGANANIIGYDETWGTSDYIKLNGMTIKNDAQVTNPASTYLMMDFGCYIASWVVVIHPYYSHYLPGAGKYESLVSPWGAMDIPSDYNNGRHNGGVVVGYADGHAAWTTADKIVKAAIDHRDGADHDSWDPTKAE